MEDADGLNVLSSSYEKVFDPAGHSWILVPPSSPVHPQDTGPRPPVTHKPDALVGIMPHSLLGEGSLPVLDVPSPSYETGSLGSAADANSLPAGALPSKAQSARAPSEAPMPEHGCARVVFPDTRVWSCALCLVSGEQGSCNVPVCRVRAEAASIAARPTLAEAFVMASVRTATVSTRELTCNRSKIPPE